MLLDGRVKDRRRGIGAMGIYIGKERRRRGSAEVGLVEKGRDPSSGIHILVLVKETGND